MANIKGIFIALELDQSKLKKSVKEAVTNLEKEFKDAQQEIADSLTIDTKRLESSLSSVAKTVNTITNAVRTESGRDAFTSFIKNSDELKSKLQELASQAGVSSEQLQDVWQRAIHANEVKVTVNAVNSLAKALDLTGDSAVEFAKSFGVSGEALDKIVAKHRKTTTSLSALAENIEKISGKKLEVTGAQLIRAEEVAKSRQLVDNISKFAKTLDLSEMETLKLARAFNLTEEQAKGLVRQVEKIESSGGGFFTSLRNLMTGGNSMAALQSGLATLGVNISTAGIVELGKVMVDTTIKVESLNTAFNSIYKDADRASSQLGVVRSITQELGLEFYQTASAAKGFFAAAETSDIKQNANEIFQAFSSAAAALKMSQEETNGMFLAISQMMSKGKISAEEMRQQLAERLPGAVQMLAKSMGVSMKQLDKMFEAGEVGLENLIGLAKEVQNTFGDAAVRASSSLIGELNKLKTSWTDFKAEFFSTDEVSAGVRFLREGLQGLKDNIESLQAAVKALLVALVPFLSGKALASFAKGVRDIDAGAKKLLETGRAANKFTASVGTLVGAFGGWFNVITLGVSGAVAAYTYFKEKSEGPKLALSEITELASQQKRVMEATAESIYNYAMSLDELSLAGEKVKLSKKLQEMEKLSNTARILGKDFFKLAGTAVSNSPEVKESILADARNSTHTARLAREQIVNNFRELRVAYDEAFKEFEEAPAALKDVALDKLQSIASAMAETLENANLAGTDTYQNIVSIVRALQSLGHEIANIQLANDIAKENLSSGGAPQTDGPAKNPAKVEFAINSNRLKKRYKSQQDFDAYALTEVFSSGELRKDGEAFKLTATQINEAIEHAAKNGKDLLTHFSETYNLSPEIVKEIKAISNEARNVVAAPSNKKLEEFRLELDTVRKRYAELADTSEMSADSVEGKLAKINDWALKSQKAIEETYSKYKKLNKVEAEEYKSKSLKLLDKEKLDKSEKALLEYVENGRAAFERFEEAKTGAHKIEILEEEYEENLEGLQKYLDVMLKKYAANAEAQKLIIEDVEKYRAALREQYEEDSLNASTDWKAGIQRGADKLVKEAADYASQWEEITVKGFSGMADALTEFCTNADQSWKDLGEAFSDLARSIVNDIIKMQMQAAVSNIAGGLFGSNGMFNFFADGGVVNSGLGSFTNGVYNTPTFFATNGGGFQRYANGGVFGEAGPEAIMPLTRMPNGRLGVASTGGGNSGNVQVNVYNSSNSKAEVRQSESANGGKTIDVLIGDVVAKQMNTPGSKLNRTVSTYTGGQQAVTRR